MHPTSQNLGTPRVITSDLLKQSKKVNCENIGAVTHNFDMKIQFSQNSSEIFFLFQSDLILLKTTLKQILHFETHQNLSSTIKSQLCVRITLSDMAQEQFNFLVG